MIEIGIKILMYFILGNVVIFIVTGIFELITRGCIGITTILNLFKGD